MAMMMTVTAMMHRGICWNDGSCQHNKCNGPKDQVANLHEYLLPLRYFVFRNSQLVNEAYSPTAILPISKK
jgi:hypothetical protein